MTPSIEVDSLGVFDPATMNLALGVPSATCALKHRSNTKKKGRVGGTRPIGLRNSVIPNPTATA